MSFLKGLRCKECGTHYPADRSFVCLECLGPLEVLYDYGAIRERVSPAAIAVRERNLWRYRELLPIDGEPITGFHSGFTPLVRARRLGERWGAPRLYLKNDSVNHPTLSYKDRVVSIALTRGVELGYTTFCCASTGNLANAVAAHAAASGFPSLVFVPRDIEPAKIASCLVYGSRLLAFEGSYDDVNRLCSEIGDQHGWGFVNVNLRPYYTEGAKTFGYEIAEQLGWRLPDHVVLPTAGGTLLPRVARAFEELRELGWVSGSARLHCAQAEGCAPIVKALHRGSREVDPVKPSTLAKSIAIGNPADGPYVLEAVERSGGWGETATDPEILEAIELLAETEGILTEPAGGTALAVAKKLIDQGRIGREDTIVIGITGNGFKSLELLSSRRPVEAALSPRLAVFQQWYEQEYRSV